MPERQEVDGATESETNTEARISGTLVIVYDHYQPARHLLANPDLIEKLSDPTLERFEKLIEKLNGLLS
jgi:hypothetical protein